jgi:hypothetical protein
MWSVKITAVVNVKATTFPEGMGRGFPFVVAYVFLCRSLSHLMSIRCQFVCCVTRVLPATFGFGAAFGACTSKAERTSSLTSGGSPTRWEC